jgi:hypothetical protein
MKILPSDTSTKLDGHEWIPKSLDTFIKELDHLVSSWRKLDHYLLFRGHRDHRWLLDCTFVRNIKQNIFGIDPLLKVISTYRSSLEYQRLLGSLFLLKFETITPPFPDLMKLDKVDPYFEWMRRIQQYPKEDVSPLGGTFLVDWTQDEKVAMFFASEHSDISSTDGAVWIVDFTATGKVLHRDLTVEEILSKYKEAFMADNPLGIPLVFYPNYQIASERAKNQDVVYIAQMDMRLDLCETWEKFERENNTQVIIKIRLPHPAKAECRRWLESKGITKKYIYPDIEFPTTEEKRGGLGA